MFKKKTLVCDTSISISTANSYTVDNLPKFKNPKIEKLYEHLSKISKEAYKDHFLISNIVFSKQGSSNQLLESYLSEEPPPNISYNFILKKLFLYLAKNFIGWPLFFFPLSNSVFVMISRISSGLIPMKLM